MKQILLLLLFLVSVISYLYAPVSPDALFMVGQLILALCMLLLFFKRSKICDRIVIKHSTLFLISFIIVYYQYPVDFLLGNEGAISPTDLSYTSQYCRGLALANIAFTSFSIGYARKIERRIDFNESQLNINTSFLNVLSIIVLIGFIATVNKSFLFRGYGIYEKGTIAEEFEKILQMSIIANFVINAVNNRDKCLNLKEYVKKHKLPIIVLLLYAGSLTIAGARYAVIRMLLVLFFSYCYVLRPRLKIATIVFAVILVSFAATIQGIIRSDGSGSISEATKDIRSNVSISPLTSELAFSVTTLHVATANVPSSIDYNYGLSFLPAILLLIPGARSLFFNFFNIPPELQNSGNFITLLGYGDYDVGAMGSSSIADVYISLGLIGIIISFFFFSRIIRYLEEYTYVGYKSIYVLAISCCFYSQMLYLNRESLFTVLFGLPYVLLFVFISVKKSV